MTSHPNHLQNSGAGTGASHPAIRRAIEVYGQEGDLTAAEETFLRAVRQADVDWANSVNTANRLHGGGSLAWQATKALASRQRDSDYTLALEIFEASIEAEDEILEIQLAMAAE